MKAQNNGEHFEWLPMIFRNPLPFAIALWARTAEISATATFLALALTVSSFFEEIVERAEDIAEDCMSFADAEISLKLNKCRRHYSMICGLIDKVNRCFGPILVMQTSIAFSLPMFEFCSIWQTLGAVSIYNFSFIHTTLRFLVWILIPSYLVSQQVGIYK